MAMTSPREYRMYCLTLLEPQTFHQLAKHTTLPLLVYRSFYSTAMMHHTVV
jgi:hypothetical protein